MMASPVLLLLLLASFCYAQDDLGALAPDQGTAEEAEAEPPPEPQPDSIFVPEESTPAESVEEPPVPDTLSKESSLATPVHSEELAVTESTLIGHDLVTTTAATPLPVLPAQSVQSVAISQVPIMPSLGFADLFGLPISGSSHQVHDRSHEIHHHHDHHHDGHNHHSSEHGHGWGDHHHHSSEHHDHGWGGWGGHHHDHDDHHHSSEEHGHGGGWGGGRRGSWHRYLHGDSSTSGGSGSDWRVYLDDDHHEGCDLMLVLLGLCGNGGTGGSHDNIVQPTPNIGNAAGNSGSAPSGSWWQNRLGDAGSQKIPNPLPPDARLGSGSGSFGSGSGSIGSGSITPFGSGSGTNIPKGMGSFDEPNLTTGSGKQPSTTFGNSLNLPKGTGSFDEPGPGSGFGQTSTVSSFDWMKQQSLSSTGTGGLKDSGSFGSGTGGLKDSGSFGSGTGGLKDTGAFGSTGVATQPSSFDDWTNAKATLSPPTAQLTAEKIVPCKSSEFVGFSNGRMRFKCDCGASGISYQEDQCAMRAPALRAPVIHGPRRNDDTFGWIGR